VVEVELWLAATIQSPTSSQRDEERQRGGRLARAAAGSPRPAHRDRQQDERGRQHAQRTATKTTMRTATANAMATAYVRSSPV
jgi:hypothetical protein